MCVCYEIPQNPESLSPFCSVHSNNAFIFSPTNVTMCLKDAQHLAKGPSFLLFQYVVGFCALI